MPELNPEIFKWARETAGLNRAEAAAKLRLGRARGKSGVERLRDFETGEAEPSRALILRMAQQYRRPLVAFYLAQVPRPGDRGRDFRTLPDNFAAGTDSTLDVLIRRVMARQRLTRELMVDEEAPVLEFVASISMEDGVETAVEQMREVLGVDLDAYRDQPGPNEGFTLLRSAAEGAGVFVLLLSNLGSHHSNIDVEAFRGFALSDEIAPFVIVNERDSKAAWSFTLLHELTHVLLGQTGVDGLLATDGIERFCNDVASEFLFPLSEAKAISVPARRLPEDLAQAISAHAEQRNLSRSMVAYKLFRVGKLQRNEWLELQRLFREEWFASRATAREASREKEGGPSYYVVRRHRIGEPLLSLVDRSMSDGSLSSSKAGMLLGVKPQNVRNLLELSR